MLSKAVIMSAFSDFQKAWAQRFPNCELPQAWEDDVRANLTKHRQKVEILKEELEKAEFYVEYLERLLADVKRVKNKPSSLSEECDPNPEKRESKLSNDREISFETFKSQHSGKKIGNENQKDSSETHVQNPHLSSKGEDCNSYVTVIEVGGSAPSVQVPVSEESQDVPSHQHDEQTPACQTENSETESPPSSLQQKKKPPAPPKKPRKAIPVQAVPPVKKACDTIETIQEDLYVATKDNLKDDAVPASEDNLVTESSEIIKDDKIIENQPVKEELEKNCEENESKLSVDENTRENNKNSSETPPYNEIDEYEEENIYDTVASDETSLSNAEVVMREPQSPTKINREDSGDYVMFSEAYEMAHNTTTRPVHPTLPMRQFSAQKSVDEEESPEYATYMNIDYFLKNKPVLPSQCESVGGDSEDEETYLMRSFSSDHEADTVHSTDGKTAKPANVMPNPSDDVFEMDSGVYSSSVESASYLCEPSTPPMTAKNENEAEVKSEVERMTMYKCILNSIIESEAIYVECLNMLLQYMKALKSTIGTSQPLLSLEDYNVIFYRIPELHSLHQTFLYGLKKQVENWDGTQAIGEGFKILASKLGVYGSFLQNYSRAIETIRKCSIDNSKFSEITKSIKLKALQGQATNLEDLLHKPVARVQKNALVLHDLLRYTPDSHVDYKTLKTALKMTQCFLNDINVSATESMFPITDRAQRHLVKNSFIVELSEGHRKLRHLFLFSDVIVCAKYKPSTRQKFTFEVKWFVPLSEVILPDKTGGDVEHIKENSPFDILSLKSRASNVRDQILKEEKGSSGKERTRVSGRNIDKHKKKLAELEAQLVLASPNLIFRVAQKMGKTFIFFLSSEFEKAQWIEAISILQTSAPTSALPISPYELQAWITSCRKHFGTNLGSFLLRSGKDEDLLVGDLYIVVHKLHGLNRPSDIFLCFEVDSYGHFFNKAKTKVSLNTVEPVFEQDFIIDLEGSQTLRILCYENLLNEGPVLRGKGALELSRSWLNEKVQEKSVSLQDLMLTMSLKYEPPELSLRRIPSSKSGGVFGVKIQQVCKKEKSTVPFLMISCIREVEKRGMHEVGIYRVSGSASDVQKLKKSFESNVYEAEQLLKEVDIHSVTGLFKMYLRELPEALFTDAFYQKFFLAFSMSDQEAKKKQLLQLFGDLPEINQGIIEYFLDHMIRIHHHESSNKMSLHNLATVFGPTLLRPGSRCSSSSAADLLTAGTVDVMAQAGIFYFFLKRRAAGLSLRSET